LALGSDGVLYAGGQFTTAGGVSANHIAHWDGTTWSALGLGMDSWVAILMLANDGTLYAGGQFSTAGNVPAKAIARWDGTTWSALGSGISGGFSPSTYALAMTDEDTLYAGGWFTRAGDNPSAFLAKALLTGLEAHDATYVRTSGQALEIPLVEVVTEVNGNPVTVVSAGPSAEGTPVTWDDTHLFYAPDHDRNDSFSYTVTNGEATSTGLITVNVDTSAPPGGIAREISVKDGIVTLTFYGTPGQQYGVQRTASLTPPITWTTLTTGEPLSPEEDGVFTFTDPAPPDGTAYYRCFQH
jgi:hypothetical protein